MEIWILLLWCTGIDCPSNNYIVVTHFEKECNDLGNSYKSINGPDLKYDFQCVEAELEK